MNIKKTLKAFGVSTLSFLFVHPLLSVEAATTPGKPNPPTSPLLSLSVGGGTHLTSSVEVFLLIGLITLLPSILIMFSCFSQVSIILGLTRQGLGTQTTPPTQVLVGLAIFITLFIMSPVIHAIDQQAWTPLQKNQITLSVAEKRAEVPLKAFMLKNTPKSDLQVFYTVEKKKIPTKQSSVGLTELVPAFSISQITDGLFIGIMIYIAFLAIDVIVGFILMVLGMVMVPPTMISLPIKVLVFVFVGGYSEIASLIFQTIKT